MSVGPKRLPRQALSPALLLLVALCAAFLVGCASDRAAREAGQIRVPDQSALDPATQALDAAVKANADQFAPRSVADARRRITLARDTLFSAARSDRALSDADRERVDALVAAARLDAREALVETQAKAVQTQLAKLQGGASDDTDTDDGSAVPGDALSTGNGPGPAAANGAPDNDSDDNGDF